jgi:nicotinamide riboside transporter PnuC
MLNIILLIRIIAIILIPALILLMTTNHGADLWLLFIGLPLVILYFLVWKDGKKMTEEVLNKRKQKLATFVIIFMLIIMIVFAIVFFKNLDYVKKNPCVVCIEKENAVCYFNEGKYYLKDGKVEGYKFMDIGG